MSGMCALNALGSRVRGPPGRHDASDGVRQGTECRLRG